MSIPAKVEILEEQLRIERQHHAFDMTEVKAESRTLLRQRILPLVMNAIDSLEIDSPAPQVALSRLRRIARLIDVAAPPSETPIRTSDERVEENTPNRGQSVRELTAIEGEKNA